MKNLLSILILFLISISIYSQNSASSESAFTPEILKTFYNFEMSMQNAGSNLDLANLQLLHAIDLEVTKQGDKAKPFRDKAYQAKKISDNFVAYCEVVKSKLVEYDSKGGSNPRELDCQLKSGSNTRISANYFLENYSNPIDKQAKGNELVAAVNNTRNNLLALLDDIDHSNIKSDLIFKQSSLDATLRIPLSLVFAVLTKFQLDAKRTEFDIVNFLVSKVNANDFDSKVVLIQSSTNCITIGQEYSAEIILATYNSKQENIFLVNGSPIEVKDGKGILKFKPITAGKYIYNVKINSTDTKSKEVKTYTAIGEYDVMVPNACIFPFKMDIIYEGIDNPISITVPGYRTEQVEIVGIRNVAISGMNGAYYLRVTKASEHVATIKVTATSDDKTIKTFEKEFKIRPLPPLISTINGLEGGEIDVSKTQGWNFINASFGPSFAYYGLAYSVNSYKCIIQSSNGLKEFSINGPALSPELKAAFLGCKKGDHISFYEIKVTGDKVPESVVQSGPIFTIL